MKTRIALCALLAVFATGIQAAVDIPAFANADQCSVWLYSYQEKAYKAASAAYATDPILATEYSHYYKWFSTFRLFSGGSRTSVCNNGNCSIYWNMQADGTGQIGGGCAYVGSVYWPQIVSTLQTEVNNMEVLPLSPSLPNVRYGVKQENIPASQKPEFSKGVLVPGAPE
jgi:hypothetical protein